MSEPFLAEIRLVGFNFAPRGWAQCDGQILPINQNQSLYSLLGTTYGGDGRQLRAARTCGAACRSMSECTMGTATLWARTGGEETTHSPPPRCPQHTHTCYGPRRADGELARSRPTTCSPIHPRGSTATPAALTALRAAPWLNAGGGQAHENMQPYLAVNFCIALRAVPLAELREEVEMSEPFVGEIRMFAGNFAPAWLGALRRAAARCLPERRALLPARHDLRRRRAHHVRPARPAGAGPDPRG